MPINIEIKDEKIVSYSDNAKSALRKIINSFINDLLNEIDRISSAVNWEGNEVTTNIVNDAYRLRISNYRTKKRNVWKIILKIITAIFSLITGSFFDLNEFKLGNVFYIISFLVLFVITIILIILDIVLE